MVQTTELACAMPPTISARNSLHRGHGCIQCRSRRVKVCAMRHGVVDSDFQDQWCFYSCRQHRVHDNDRDAESLGALENVSVRTGVLSSFVYGPNSS